MISLAESLIQFSAVSKGHSDSCMIFKEHAQALRCSYKMKESVNVHVITMQCQRSKTAARALYSTSCSIRTNVKKKPRGLADGTDRWGLAAPPSR